MIAEVQTPPKRPLLKVGRPPKVLAAALTAAEQAFEEAPTLEAALDELHRREEIIRARENEPDAYREVRTPAYQKILDQEAWAYAAARDRLAQLISWASSLPLDAVASCAKVER